MSSPPTAAAHVAYHVRTDVGYVTTRVPIPSLFNVRGQAAREQSPVNVLSWWNLIFVLPAVAALLYLVLLATGTVAGDTGDIDADLDPGDFHGVEHAFGGAGAAPDGEPGSPGGLLHILSLVGVGRAPLSLLLVSFCFLWGFLGWLGNAIFGAVIASPAVFIWPSLALALVGSLVLTRLLAGGLHRLLPATETYAVSNRQLVGRLANVRYGVTDRMGSAQLYDDQGRMHEVPVRILPGEAPIPAHSSVVLWRYDLDTNTFLVTPEQDIDNAEAPRRRLHTHGEVGER